MITDNGHGVAIIYKDLAMQVEFGNSNLIWKYNPNFVTQASIGLLSNQFSGTIFRRKQYK